MVSGGYMTVCHPPTLPCLCLCEASSCDLLDIIPTLRHSLMFVLDDVALASNSPRQQQQQTRRGRRLKTSHLLR